MEDNRLAKWLAETYNKQSDSDETALSEIIKNVDHFSIEPIDENKLLARIKQDDRRIQNKSGLFTLIRLTAVAASIALIVGYFYFFNQQTTHIGSTKDAVLHVLPDNSQITLNSYSEISFDQDFSNRFVSLTGEAFFEVEKGTDFQVETTHGIIKVLGTSFNVYSRDSFLIVSCSTGKVEIITPTRSQIILPQQRVSLQGGELILESVSEPEIRAWSEEETRFNKSSLALVVNALVHQYDLELNTQAIDFSDKEFTGSFIHSDLDKALQMVFVPFNITYTIENNELDLRE